MDQQQTRNFLHQRNGEMDRMSEEIMAINGDYVEK